MPHAFPNLARALALFADLDRPAADRLLRRVVSDEPHNAAAMRAELTRALQDPNTDWGTLVSNASYELTDADDPEARQMVVVLLWDALYPKTPEQALRHEFGTQYLIDEMPRFTADFVRDELPSWARASAGRLSVADPNAMLDLLGTLRTTPSHPFIAVLSDDSGIDWREDWETFTALLSLMAADLETLRVPSTDAGLVRKSGSPTC